MKIIQIVRKMKFITMYRIRRERETEKETSGHKIAFPIKTGFSFTFFLILAYFRSYENQVIQKKKKNI